jgi:ABC-type transport system involved in multi-copper enzyme maturation permease subunit
MQAIPTYSFRRIWALARLAFLEALRNRVTWLLLITLLPVLFPMAWFLGSKSENELRLRVSWMSIPLQVILLFTAALLSAFAIPNDVKKQNIFTIVTKPVKRFEMILGRFLGYGLLLTLSCFGATAVSLIFISTSNIDEKAREETYTARVPVRGKLTFESRSSEFIGTDVGREFSYRKYIGGDQLSPQRGVWSFTELPSSLGRAEDDVVPCVFTFDIFRLTKGEENRGVDVNIRAVSYKCGQVPPPPNDGTWEWKDIKLKEEYRTEARELLKKLPRFANQDNFDVTAVLGATPRESKDWPEIWKIANQLAEKYGFFEIPTKEVYDYHPEQVILPAGLFRGASAGTPPNAENGQPQARVKIYVKCTSRSQMLGMAEPDLFVMEAEQSFQQNYLKSAVGLWCRTMIILGMALCISAYLDGIVTFLTVAFLFVAGFFSSYIAEMSTGKSSTGGPFMSLNQLLQAKQPTSVIEGTATDQAALFGDKGFAWVVRRFINLIPDVNAFSWTQFVSEGFNVSNEYLIMNVLTLLGYLIPWFLLGFYLIRSREVAA